MLACHASWNWFDERNIYYLLLPRLLSVSVSVIVCVGICDITYDDKDKGKRKSETRRSEVYS